MLDMGSDPDSDCFTTFFNSLSSNNSNFNNKIQRRFTNQQIESLETIFQSESKLRPRKKLELAKDLGLEPRQVAIWFQNKRARWKSKKLERDYNILKASYDSLSSRFDLLSKENQSLTLELHEVEKKAKSSSTRGHSNNSIEEKASKKGLGIVSDADSTTKPNFIERDSDNDNDNDNNMFVVDMVKNDNWDDLVSHQVLDGNISNQWWDFWC